MTDETRRSPAETVSHAKLTEARSTLLLRLYDAACRGTSIRLKETAERSWLKRNGFISSRQPNSNVIMPAIGGHGHRWFLTDLGRAAARQLTAYQRPEGGR